MPNSMPESVSADTSSSSSSSRLWLVTVFLTGGPVFLAMLVYKLESFDPAPIPVHEFTHPPLTAALRNERMLQGSEKVGYGVLKGPEDLLYDAHSKLIYTGCEDGWIKRVTLNDSPADSLVHNWINTGGRPLGIAFANSDPDADRITMIVADAYKGLLKISGNSTVLLTDEAEGKKFKLTDGVDVADDGMIYFTDASYKYYLREYILDIFEGKPNGRLLSFDPVTKETKVLVSDLYFANGVVLSPDQTHLVYCETSMRRCRKFYIKGKNAGRVEKFIETLPGLPDNIRYDGEGHYLIALATEFSTYWDLAYRYPFIRKVSGMVVRYLGMPPMGKSSSGVFIVDLDGKPIAHYYDPEMSLISSAIKIGDHLYCGSVHHRGILHLDVNQHPARAII
ncbi:hypothetical protein WN944_020830 [Citrus x changshan-huyou]|uniref:Strictosidine synthase conserved region domain-containing protein n=1 Tax=Citrus x changshan-huyou TaxID=2935761 RepID=A0AAP0N0F8_9ROSI